MELFMPRLLPLIALLCCAEIHAAQTQCSGPISQPYTGPMFDAMAQTNQWLNGDAAVKVARANGIIGIALFARVHSKQDGRQLVLNMAKDNFGFIIVGAPKLFDAHGGDISDSYLNDVASGKYSLELIS